MLVYFDMPYENEPGMKWERTKWVELISSLPSFNCRDITTAVNWKENFYKFQYSTDRCSHHMNLTANALALSPYEFSAFWLFTWQWWNITSYFWSHHQLAKLSKHRRICKIKIILNFLLVLGRNVIFVRTRLISSLNANSDPRNINWIHTFRWLRIHEFNYWFMYWPLRVHFLDKRARGWSI